MFLQNNQEEENTALCDETTEESDEEEERVSPAGGGDSWRRQAGQDPEEETAPEQTEDRQPNPDPADPAAISDHEPRAGQSTPPEGPQVPRDCSIDAGHNGEQLPISEFKFSSLETWRLRVSGTSIRY